MSNTAENTGRARYQTIGLLLGPALFLLLQGLPAPEGVSPAGWSVVAVAVLMASWWATEAIPVPATSLLPLILLPVLDVTSSGAASAPYARPVIFLLLGGFLAAMAMQKWNLHRRIALNILARAGSGAGVADRWFYGSKCTAIYVDFQYRHDADDHSYCHYRR